LRKGEFSMRATVKSYLVIFALFIVGCAQQGGVSTTGKGALTGGALGAGLGAIIGSQSGNAGAGVAIGTAAGLLAGGAMGSSIENQDRQISAREQSISRQEQVLQENRRLIEELRSKGTDARSTDRGVLVNLPDVLFEFGSANMTPSAKRAAKDISDAIKTVPSRHVYVEGHTDSVGTLSYNQKLSENRAWAVADSLVTNGVGRDHVLVKGFGENNPIASNSTESGRQRNRRVEVIIGNR
jgi:outer membrane protein OmpA-like peptidoglycan-associated protein